MLGEQLKRLAEEIATSYEARIQGIADLKEGTVSLQKEAGELLKTFSKSRLEVARDTREELAQFKVECQQGVVQLKQATHELLKEISARNSEVKEVLRGELGEFRAGLAEYKAALDTSEVERKQDAGEAIEVRKGVIGEIKEETHSALAGFTEARQAMWKDLKVKLEELMKDIQRFQADLADSETERKKKVRVELKEASELIRSQLAVLMKALRVFQTDLVKVEKERKNQTQESLKDMRVELNTLFRNLRKDLSRFRVDLNKAEKDRSSATQKDLKNMSEDLWERLSEFHDHLSSAVSEFLGVLNVSRTEGAMAWREILGALRGGDASKTAQVKTQEAKSVTETRARATEPKVVGQGGAVAPKEEALDGDESLTPQEGLVEDIMDLLNDHPEGLKLVEISEKLRVLNWRSLIPVMRELLDDEEVKKEEILYFAV